MAESKIFFTCAVFKANMELSAMLFPQPASQGVLLSACARERLMKHVRPRPRSRWAGSRFSGFRLQRSESPPHAAWPRRSLTAAVWSSASNKDTYLAQHSAELLPKQTTLMPQGLGWHANSGAACCDPRPSGEEPYLWALPDCGSSEGPARQKPQDPAAPLGSRIIGKAGLTDWPCAGTDATMYGSSCFVVSKCAPVCHSPLQSGLTAGSNYCSNHIK